MEKLSDNGIETGIHYNPIHKMSFYKNSKLRLPITERVTKSIMSLPCHPNLTDNEISYIIKCVNKFSL